MTYTQAQEKAIRLARKHDRDYFVVIEAGEYQVADDLDLDTFFCGISQNHILYCTGDK